MNDVLRTLNFIDGQSCPSITEASFEKTEPATGQLFTLVADSSEVDVNNAVLAARNAFDYGPWRTMGSAARAKLIMKLADLVEENADALSITLAREQGRPISEMRMMDLPVAVDTLRYFAGWADKLEGRFIPTAGYMGKPTVNYTIMEPVGVAAQIIPWNAPLMICIWKLAPALAAGCTVVIKPSEEAPVSVSALASLIADAGFPAGVVNIVNGRGPTAGRALVNHAGVDKISFTGSTAVGRSIAADIAGKLKKVTLELGGKAPQIVFPDANIDAALQGVAMGLFVNQGQTCAAGSRVLVHRSIADDFANRLAEVAKSLKLGDPLDPSTTMGALINDRHKSRVLEYIALGKSEGARIVAGEESVPPVGHFVRPTIFAGVDNRMRIAQEEIFGPVGMIIPFDSTEEAVQIANNVQFALSATVWTRDLSIAHSVAAQLQVGAVAINGWSPLDARLPWGGFKDSGVGHDLSKTSILSYLREKVVTAVL
ncbi:aldehyde dehydrogenase family protein [Paraburkholderia guartelaensis]|uniref:Aldehyde dehydrogenase family protein n=1 Tax=Paraburkholderia guartelaensis TaxID=2546446 RepID=A0A4R5L3X3_9BURK|nr:aldehyde dehydrogenase family protein [Paraburkholderia guartelaensis]TDG02870.1 aldehyde dehydrogenase family protein [Paraburkholderia guartelaensis]